KYAGVEVQPEKIRRLTDQIEIAWLNLRRITSAPLHIRRGISARMNRTEQMFVTFGIPCPSRSDIRRRLGRRHANIAVVRQSNPCAFAAMEPYRTHRVAVAQQRVVIGLVQLSRTHFSPRS